MKAQVSFGLSCVLILILFLSCIKTPDLKINRSETFFNNLNQEPENLHPIRSTDYYSAVVQYYILESLLKRSDHTYEWEPSLAKKWEISPDGKSFTFELRNHLKWSDGVDLTVQDIKFSFEAYKNPKYGGIRYIPYFEKLRSVEILDDKTVRFKVKEPYFGNFGVVAGMDIIPEHIYRDPKARLSKTIVGSGPYKLDSYIKGKFIVLKHNSFWFERKDFIDKGKWNFKKILFRFVKTEEDKRLRMEKEHLDFSTMSPEYYIEKTNQAPWGTKIKKVKYQNKQPTGYGFIGFNFKKNLFKDKKVRLALAHLLNRELINKKFFYNQKELARGPWYFWSEYANPDVLPIKFNFKKAVKLLKSAHWEDKDQNGILEKTIQGQKKEFVFSLFFSNPESEKILTLYQQDLKKAGIQLKLQILDWTSFIRLINDQKFDAVMLGWGAGGIHVDPKAIWHTDSSRNKGTNFISYSNPQVDALIEKGRLQMNQKERVQTFRKVYKLIAEDVPYIFLFNSRKKFYGFHTRIQRTADSLNYSNGLSYWNFKSQESKRH